MTRITPPNQIQLLQQIKRLRARIAELENPSQDLSAYYLDNVLMQLPVGVAIVEGPELRYFKINQHLADINNLPIEQHLGRPIAEVHEHLRDTVVPILTKVLATGEATNPKYFTVKTKDGTDRHLMEFHSAIDKRAVISIVIDISDQRRMEQALSRSNEELDEYISSLKSTQHQLIQTAKLASIGQLTAGLAHELNQPLGRIYLTAELIHSMLSSAKALDKPRVLKHLERIMQDVDNTKSLMSHLRMYSHQDVSTNITLVDLKHLIDDMLILFNHRITIHEIDFTLTFDHQQRPLYGDSVQIEQVLNNLMSNAIDALKKSPKRQLTITTSDQEHYLVINIKDSGHGMSESTVENIFDPFYTTKASGEGTGLGLSISKGIVDNHQGKITVQSQLDKGSCFTVYLPTEETN